MVKVEVDIDEECYKTLEEARIQGTNIFRTAISFDDVLNATLHHYVDIKRELDKLYEDIGVV